MPSGPVLTELDKQNLKIVLLDLCEKSWTLHGYKKTSIKNLCQTANISIGTFYSLFPTKECLFFETIDTIQQKLTSRVYEINKKNPTKEGFSLSLKTLLREYNSKPFLYNIYAPDFQAFISKLPAESIEKIKLDSILFLKNVLSISNLKLKIKETEAYGIFGALLSTVYAKDTLSTTCDYFAVFDFMVDNLIPQIFE